VDRPSDTEAQRRSGAPVFLGLGRLPGSARRRAIAHVLTKAGFNPDEPRADSLGSFVVTAGSIVQGRADPIDFAAALQSSGKFGINGDGTKVPTYVRNLAATIRGLRAILASRSP
jgi:hypothetical protein